MALLFCKCGNKGLEVTECLPQASQENHGLTLILSFLTLPGSQLWAPCIAIKITQLPSGFHQFSLGDTPPPNHAMSL